MRHHLVATTGLLALALLAACGGDDNSTSGATVTATTSAGTTATGSTTSTTSGSTPVTPVIDPGDGGHYAPEIDPANFVAGIDNPYMPWIAGSRWVYRGEADGEPERTVVVVTNRHKTIQGIEATVVHDRVFSSGELKEDTYDWYAQDGDGNVWYLGEDTKEYEDGKVASTEGSWEAGVDGALPGIVMPADPSVGHAYRQEYYAGEAEDMGEIIDVGGSVGVPAGHYDDVVTTKDWTPLEPDAIEQKMYAPGVGVVREELVAGGDELNELVEFTTGG
jgi:hypothetical protein